VWFLWTHTAQYYNMQISPPIFIYLLLLKVEVIQLFKGVVVKSPLSLVRLLSL